MEPRKLAAKIWMMLPALLAGLCGEPAPAQPAFPERFIAHTWTASDGLPDNSATAVLQTADGFLWVGTPAGLARFDGLAFRRVPFPELQESAAGVTSLCQDQAGNLFVGTDKGDLFRCAGGHFERLGPRRKGITALAIDEEGRLFVGAMDGLSQWNGDHFRNLAGEVGLPEERVVTISPGRSGKLWVVMPSGVYWLSQGSVSKYQLSAESGIRPAELLGIYEDQQNGIWGFADTYVLKLPAGNRFNYFRSGHVPSIRVQSVLAGRDGQLWVGVGGPGLFQFVDNDFQHVEMKAGGEPSEIQSKYFRRVSIPTAKEPSDVRCICEDPEGDLWLGTGAGLVQLRRAALHSVGPAEGLPSNLAVCMAAYPSNQVIIAYADGTLFTGPTRNAFEPYRLLDPTDMQPLATSLCVTPGGEVWMASAGSGLSCLAEHRRIIFGSSQGLSDNFLTCVCASPEGTVWASTRSGDIYRHDGNEWRRQGSVNGTVKAMLAADSKRLWVGTGTGEVWCIDNSKQKLVIEPAGPESEVTALALDFSGCLWAGTRGAGLRCYSPAIARAWKPATAFPQLEVRGLAFDREGNLWIAAKPGVLLAGRPELEGASGNFLKLRLAAPLEKGERDLTGAHGLVYRDGALWLLDNGEVAMLETERARKERPAPRVYLDSVKVNGRQWLTPRWAGAENKPAAPATFRMPARVRSMEFEYTSPQLAAPEGARFRHTLEGFDAAWIDGNLLDRRARYGAVPPGNYRFRVQTADAYGAWNTQGASVSFLVPTPFWRAPWAIGVFCGCLAGIVYAVARFVSHRRLRHRLLALERSEEMSRERMRISQDMHDQIGSKLAKISYLSESVKTELNGANANARSIESLGTTSRDLLRSLDQMVWAVNPRNDSLEQLAGYIARYATDFFQDTAISCEFNLPDVLPPIPLSAEVRHNLILAFGEVLTNTLKHSGASNVRVELGAKHNQVRIVVADNGRGFDLSPLAGADSSKGRSGQGIPGLRSRLQKLHGECRIRTAPGQGTTVTLSIPSGLQASAL